MKFINLPAIALFLFATVANSATPGPNQRVFNLQRTNGITFYTNGSTLTISNSIGSGGGGNLFNTGASTSTSVPGYTDTTGTNVAPVATTGTGNIVRQTAPTLIGQVLLSSTNNIMYPNAIPAMGAGNTNLVIDFSVAYLRLSTTTNLTLLQSTNRLAQNTNVLGTVFKIAADGGNVIVRWNASWTNINGVVTSPVTITNGNWGFFSFYCDGASETNVAFAYAYR